MQADVVIIGAGAAGLMCAIEAGKRGRSVLVLEHNAAVGEKIRISGGGRCNFTNRNATSANYLSQNPHFCKSALARYTPRDFIALIERHHIAYHERKHGQLFCDTSAQSIIDMLLAECRETGVRIVTSCGVDRLVREEQPGPVEVYSASIKPRFRTYTTIGAVSSESVVIATGGLSIPALGATPFGLRVAEQFGLSIVRPRPGLVPLTFARKDVEAYQALSGISIDVSARCGDQEFREACLFTHSGLSGPAILQISSYWNHGEPVTINLLPEENALDLLNAHRGSRKELGTILEQFLPSRFVRAWLGRLGGSKALHAYAPRELESIAQKLHAWEITPAGTEGYKKAEVMVGGIDTGELSSKTMEVRSVSGLFCIGEVVDVTGWLGGFNFQWAWSSGWAAGGNV